MKKLAVTALSLFLVLIPNQAKTSTVTQVQEFPKRSVSKIRTQTKNALVRVVPRAQRRLLVTNGITDGDDGPPGSNELDLHGLYRRPQVSNRLHVDDDISDYVQVRLAVARARAQEVYRQKWC